MMKKTIFLSVILLMTLCSFVSYMGAGSSITLWYLRFEGNITDYSGNSRSGTYTGGAYSTQYGRFGQGGFFDGSSSYISTNGMAALTTRTVMAWVRSSDVTTSQTIFSQWRYVSSTDAQHTFFGIKSSKIYFESDTEPTNDGTSDGTNATLTSNTWYHVAMTLTGTTLKLYVNGVLDKSVNLYMTVDGFTPSTNGTTIGCYHTFYTTSLLDFFLGYIDEVIVENVVWSPEKIKKYYTYCKTAYSK